jgi:hypothetical protein
MHKLDALAAIVFWPHDLSSFTIRQTTYKSFSVIAVSVWATGQGIILLIKHIAVQEYSVHWGSVVFTVFRKWKILRRK